MSLDFTPAGFFTALLLSALGMVLFSYGKRQRRASPLAAGLALLALPYLLPGLWSLLASGLVLAGLWLAERGA